MIKELTALAKIIDDVTDERDEARSKLKRLRQIHKQLDALCSQQNLRIKQLEEQLRTKP